MNRMGKKHMAQPTQYQQTEQPNKESFRKVNKLPITTQSALWGSLAEMEETQTSIS